MHKPKRSIPFTLGGEALINSCHFFSFIHCQHTCTWNSPTTLSPCPLLIDVRCELDADEFLKNCCDQHCRRVLCRRRWIRSGLLLEFIIREFSFPSFVTLKTWQISTKNKVEQKQKFPKHSQILKYVFQVITIFMFNTFWYCSPHHLQ